MSEIKPKRVTIRRAQQTSPKQLEIYHSSKSILNDAITTLGNEITKIRVRSHNLDQPLHPNDIKVLNESIKSLLAAEKHQLEVAKANDISKKLEKMSDTELLEFAKSVINPDKTLETEVKPEPSEET